MFAFACLVDHTCSMHWFGSQICCRCLYAVLLRAYWYPNHGIFAPFSYFFYLLYSVSSLSKHHKIIPSISWLDILICCFSKHGFLLSSFSLFNIFDGWFLIHMQLAEDSMIKLDKICREANVLLIFARSYGLTGFVRISVKVIFCYFIMIGIAVTILAFQKL